MTSNIGSHFLLEGTKDGQITEQARDQVQAEMRRHFRPEFLNRVDEIVVFKPLQIGEITRIVDLQLALLQQRLDVRSISLQLTPAAKKHLAEAGYDPVYGARPLKRVIQRELETILSRKLLNGEIPDKSRVLVDWQQGQLSFSTGSL